MYVQSETHPGLYPELGHISLHLQDYAHIPGSQELLSQELWQEK